MKELFCGSLMMTWMAAQMFQLPVSQPDDLLDGFDYLKAENQEEIMRQLECDDPWLTVIAWPCGPWGSWARFQLGRGCVGAENVTRKREEALARVLGEGCAAPTRERPTSADGEPVGERRVGSRKPWRKCCWILPTQSRFDEGAWRVQLLM